MSEDLNHKGVVGIFANENGRAIATVSDFKRDGYGGFSLFQSQRIRCRKALVMEVVRKYSSPDLYRAVGIYEAEKIVENLCRDHGCSVQYLPVNHDEEPA